MRLVVDELPGKAEDCIFHRYMPPYNEVHRYCEIMGGPCDFVKMCDGDYCSGLTTVTDELIRTGMY